MQIFVTALFAIYFTNAAKIGRIDDYHQSPGAIDHSSYLSKVTEWLFPEEEPKQQHRAAKEAEFNSYNLPHNIECNPCNKEPWIPIISNYGSNTMIGFVQPSEISKPQFNYDNMHGLNPPGVNSVYSGYGVPNKPHTDYGVPQNPSQNYGPPQNDLRPPSSYGVPLIPHKEYGIPQNFGPPPSSPGNDLKPPGTFGVPNQPHKEYGVPQNPPQNYGPPQNLPGNDLKPPGTYGVPNQPHKEYGIPQNFGPPPSPPGNDLKPPATYGVPNQPHKEYGVPPNDIRPPNYLPPGNGHQNVGQISHINNLGPPPYGPPGPPINFGRPPKVPLRRPPPRPIRPIPLQFRAPKIRPPPRGLPLENLQPTYGPPLADALVSNYGNNFPVPEQDHGVLYQNIPSQSSYLNLAFSSTNITSPNTEYHAPNIEVHSPDFNQRLPDNPPVSFSGLEENQFNPSSLNNYEGLSQILPFPQPNFDSLISSAFSSNITDSYGPPPSGPISNSYSKPTSDEYLPPKVELPIASEQNHVENVAPNNLEPVLPTQNTIQNTNHIEKDSAIQIVSSVPVNNFVSSVQYPTDVIQSPLIDLSKDQGIGPIYNTDSYEDNIQIPLNPEPQSHSSLKPIIVEEDYHEASNSKHSISIHNGTNEIKGSDVKINSLSDLDEESKILLKDIIPQPFIAPKPNDISSHQPKFNQDAFATNEALFVPPPPDNTTWTPHYNTITTSLQPPKDTWVQKVQERPYKNPKQIQIIVPYITNKESNKYAEGKTFSYNEPSVFMKVPEQNSQWTQYNNPEDIRKLQPVANIRDILESSGVKTENYQHLPFDILKLQKNIDDWTEQEYNTEGTNNLIKITSSRYNHTKKIPDEYFSTTFSSRNDISTEPSKHFDYLASGSFQYSVGTKKHNISKNDFEKKKTITKLAPIPNSKSYKTNNKTNQTFWDKTEVAVSPLTKEKVYVVTPLPWKSNDSLENNSTLKQQNNESHILSFTSPRFKIRPDPKKHEHQKKEKKEKEDSTLLAKGIFSQLSKLINDLESTTPDALTNHPLLGRMAFPINPDKSTESQILKESTTSPTTVKSKNIQSESNKIQR